MIVHHSHLIHHYPMHMIHMTCPGCGYGKSTVARPEGYSTEHDNNKTSQYHRLLKDANVKDSQWQSSNTTKRSVADKKSSKPAKKDEHHKKRKDGHKKKKDVVVNRPPIIYHPPPEVYHRPDIVVHRAPILIHRPPIVYHQPPVVVHRPAVVYHQPPIVFHQPAPAVNQPLLYSHDNFVVHPMAFASHMGSVVNDAGHYVGIPHGGVTNYPENIIHGHLGQLFPSLNPHSWSRRAEVSKPHSGKKAKVGNGKRSAELKHGKNGKGQDKNDKPVEEEVKQAKGERKNKVIVARPSLIYHPPPEIYDQPDVVVHRPDIVIHRPSIVYHQPSVVVHRAPVVYQQPPVVFHQPSPMVSQPIYHAHDTYVAHPMYHPQTSHVSHSSTYVGAPHYYPGHNSYGWGLPGNAANAPPVTARVPFYGYQSGSAYPGFRGYGFTPSAPSYGTAFGRSKVENDKSDKSKKKDKMMKSKTGHKERRRRRSSEISERHFHRHNHHHHHHHHHHGHHYRGSKRFYHFRPISSFAHLGHRKHVVIIHRPPLIYRPPPQVYRRPDIMMHLPPLVYHRPALMFQQPPTIVHHPPIVYHQPPVVFHNPPSIVHSPVIHSHDMFSPSLQHIMVPTSSYVHPAGNYFGPVVSGPAYGKSDIERTDAEKDSSKTKSESDSESKHDKPAKSEQKRNVSNTPEKEITAKKGSKKQNVDLVVHQPPIVYRPPPDIFDKPPVIMHQPPMVVHRPPILIHRVPVVVHRPPVIIHRPPIILHHPAPIYHVAHGHFFHPMRYAFGKSTVEGERQNSLNENDEKHDDQKNAAKVRKPKTNVKEGEKKNTVLINRPAMIYHPPPEIYDQPNLIVHRPDIIIHRPSIVYHQPSVVVHRPPVIYHQPPVVFHQPSPMVHQPVLHAHDTYLAHPVPVPYTSQIHHTATYVGAPHFFNQPSFGGYSGHAFGKSEVEKITNKNSIEKDGNSSKKKAKDEDKSKTRSTRNADSKKANKTKNDSSSLTSSKGHKKNKVIINRPALIYHPPPEIYDRPDLVVHRPDIIIHRPSIVYHQPSVVVHRPAVVYQAPTVVFHQPPPLVNQPIMHAHDTYVAHPVPVPHSSYVDHTSTYVGSPHYYPGGWNHGWIQPPPNGLAYGKSNVPATKSKTTRHSKSTSKDKVKRSEKDIDKDDEKEIKKKNQVLIHRPPLIYHPPPEVYHKPDVIVHRPDIVIHRPAVIYHQPSVVVHRPPVVYHQPPVVFHQPSPMVSQPVLHAHDMYVAHPYFTHYSSDLYHGGSYVGAPHFYNAGWGGHGYGFDHAFGKSEVESAQKKQKHDKAKNKVHLKDSRRTLEKEVKEMEDEMTLKNQTDKVGKGNKKNLVIMRRPPLIYHPPPEIYDKPDVIMHRPDLVIHRPSIVFHQPSVVVHRPPVIYHQPPVIFHQPSPMVHQPILHAHDTYVAHPHFVPFTSHVQHTGSYVGAPHFYPGGWGIQGHGYGFGHAFGKSKVEKTSKHQRKSKSEKGEDGNDSEGDRRSLPVRETSPVSDKFKFKKKIVTKGHKKNVVIMRRPSLIYHPPPEIYHKPDIILHRPDIVIHRPSVVFHQPSVVVHRPPVIYHQPPVVFHQPSPMVQQPIFHSHETYVAHPHFVPYLSHVTHAGSYVGAPHFFHGHWGPSYGFGHFRNFGHAFGKSKVEKGKKKDKFETVKMGRTETSSRKTKTVLHKKIKRAVSNLDLRGGKQHSKLKQRHTKLSSDKGKKKVVQFHPEKEDKKVHHKGHKKNLVLLQRPALIYHPPPEIYDRPDIIVHRPDVVIHQPSVVYHQPSVVVHRPPIIYHPPPVVFHQPAPMVRQPVYTSHDTYHSYPNFVPYASHINHMQTYVGAPHYYPGGWRHGYGYGLTGTALVPNVEPSRFNRFGSSWFNSPSYGSNYIAPTGAVVANGIRNQYRSAFAKSNVFKHEKDKDSKKTDDYKKKERDTKKSGQVAHKEGKRNRRSVESVESSKVTLHSTKTRLHRKGNEMDKGGKKNFVVINRPSLVYHPPPEIYHKPDVIMHRPDVVIHQPSVVYHQPSVVVHRPPIIYNQPPVVFHQPAPMVNQPIFHSHENYIAHPTFVPYTSQIHHSGTYVGAPDFFSGGVSSAYGHAFGKSHVLKYKSKAGKQNTKSQRKNEMRKGEVLKESTKGKVFHPQEKKNEKASKKNDIVVSRPPIIYHPPPEIYHRPDIVVHRAPIVLHRPPIIYHQPPVVVHRPAVVYHQPPVVFHQPPPTVHQPILHSHDSFVMHPAARFYPQGSTISHSVSYVGIPNHVIHGDELGFEHLQHFHRSQIEHSGKDKSTTQMAKSTISKIPTTNKENTETTITDQTEKKTLRSKISQPTRTKRQLIGSHSLFGSLSPINNVQDSQQSVEQNEKLSTIPGVTSNRENEIAKRQLIVPESTENEYHPSLPSVYNTLEMAALQNQALAASETLRPPNGDDEVQMPDFASTLTALQGLGRPEIGRYPFSLQPAAKDDSPDVRVHVETTKSSIPVKARKKRQIFPLFQQQNPAQIPHVLFQSPSLGNLGGTIHATTPPSVYHLLSPFHSMYHPIGDPYNYLGIASQLQHRPHVNINVQSARSKIPDIEHDIQKRSGNKNSKREFLAVTPPFSPGFPFGVGTGTMNNYISYLPYPALSRLPYPLMPRLNYPDESEEEVSALPEELSLHRPSPIPHSPYSTLSEDEDNGSPELSPLASYLSALYNSFLGYPYYHRHHKPKVHVEVHASKSQIPKATDNKQEVHSRISKRQLYNFLPGSPLTENHYPLPAALNYGIQGFHQNSPRVSINVETVKKNGIPVAKNVKRSSVTSKLQASKKTRTGGKRDELIENGSNGQEISQYQGNSNYLNQPDNQFVATSESSQPQQEVTSSNENEPTQELPQQQSDQQTNEQQQEQQMESGQQTVPGPNEPMMFPFQAQQLAYRAPLAPIQVPMQLPMQSALQTPLVPSYMVPSQGMIPSALPIASNTAIPEQQYAQQTSDIEDGQPKHTSINVNVAAKSSVPKKTSKKSKTFHTKRQFAASPQGYGIPIKTTKKSAMEKGPGNHQSISLLTRFPAMQVLPQTFKQNGVMMPAFNTLPVNHRIKANGMLLEELQRQRKHRIPKKAEEIKIGKKENAKKRQFYVLPQSPMPIQQYASALHQSVHPRPRVSVNVEVNKRKFVVPIEKHLKGVKREKQSKEETKTKRQVYGIERLPNMVQMPLANPPLLSQMPLKSQQPRVSVNVEIAKKKATLLKQKRQKLKRANKEKRQIYGLSELPHEGLIQQPFSLASQTQQIGYLPSTMHSPHVSINVETSKRSEEVNDNIHKRQVLGLQPSIGETFDQAQEPISPGQASFQSGEVTQENAAQPSIQVQDQSKPDESSLMATQSNFLSAQQQQADELPSEQEISRDALNDNLNERPRVSIHVEASKRGKSERKQRKNSPVKRGAKGEKGDKREFLRMGQTPEDYQPNFKEQKTIAGPRQEVSLQQQQHVYQQPFAYLPPIQQQQQVQQLQPIMLPVAQSAAEKTRPKVSINIQASKSSISKNDDSASEQKSEKKLRRQLLSTIPLLSSLGQTTAPGDVRRSTVPQSIENRGRIQDRIQKNKIDRRSWKRQLYNYLGGQQEQNILPGQALQDTTEAEQQQENIPVQPVQVFQQDSNLQAQVGVPEPSLFETTNQANLQQYPSQTDVPQNSQQASVSPIQSEPSLTSLGSLQNPHVSINVQTAKSHVPNRLTTKRSIFERQKVKRQFDILGGGGVIERRRGPKFLSVPLKKPRVRNMFGLENNLNKPVGVFSDPLANLLAGGITGRKRPKLGGIRLDSPTGVGALPIKGAANPIGGALSSDVGAPAILQNNAAQTIAPFVQEPAVTGRTPLFPPSGIAGPRVDAIGNGETGEFPLADLTSSRPAILPLRTVNQAVIPNLPFEAAAPPPQVRPLLLAPRVFPIFPMPPPMAVPPPMLEDPAPELPHVPPQIGPVLPPVWPMPLPNMGPPPPHPSPESLFPESDGDKPSVHVNVETSRSNVPVVKSHPKKQANGPANRG